MLKSLVTEIFGVPAGGVEPAPEVQQLPQFSHVLLVFSDTDNVNAARQENLVLSERGALAERDMHVIRIRGDTVMPLFGAVAGTVSAEALRTALDVEAGEFQTLLIGRDGAVMLRVHQPISAAELFVIIDAMPPGVP